MVSKSFSKLTAARWLGRQICIRRMLMISTIQIFVLITHGDELHEGPDQTRGMFCTILLASSFLTNPFAESSGEGKC